MKIAFATIYDLRDIRRGSGTFHCLAKELERQGHVVHYLGPFEDIGFPLFTRAFKRLSLALGQKYRSWQDPFIGRRLGNAIAKRLQALNHDVLLTNDYTIAAYTKSCKPLVIYTDYVFAQDYSRNSDLRMSNLSAVAVLFCHSITRRALRRAGLCIWAPRWALLEAQKYNVVDEARMEIIEFGANLTPPPQTVVDSRRFATCVNSNSVRLLFVGKDWQRKGGDVAAAAAQELNRRGIHATLQVVGAIPPQPLNPQVVVLHGLLDKSDPAQREQLQSLYRTSNALILPSRSEGFVIVPQEAAAYGLPTLAYRSQGVADAVRDGESGVLLPLDASPSAFADIISGWFASPATYDRLVRTARAYFDSTANWERTASRLVAAIKSHNLCPQSPGALQRREPQPAFRPDPGFE